MLNFKKLYISMININIFLIYSNDVEESHA